MTETNLVRHRGFRIASMPLGVVLVIALAVTMFVFPVRTWLHQREVLAQRESEYSAYADMVEQLQDQILYLKTPEGLRDAIRTQLGYLQPNERRLPMMDIPALSATLPERWPYTLVSGALIVRTIEVADRRAKDEQELAAMRQSQAVTERAIELACRLVARAQARADGTLMHEGEPLTSERVRGEIDAFLARSGFDNPRSIVAGGPQGGDCHHDGTGPLRTGEPVIIDVFPRSKATGYWGDSTRCVVHGAVPPEVARMHAAVVQAKAAVEQAEGLGVALHRHRRHDPLGGDLHDLHPHLVVQRTHRVRHGGEVLLDTARRGGVLLGLGHEANASCRWGS